MKKGSDVELEHARMDDDGAPATAYLAKATTEPAVFDYGVCAPEECGHCRSGKAREDCALHCAIVACPFCLVRAPGAGRCMECHGTKQVTEAAVRRIAREAAAKKI
jgi:hypothetical protein